MGWARATDAADGSSALCWVAYEGVVDPLNTAALDAALARYTAAGCTVGYCPGPSPHPTECIRNHRGGFSCGGL